MKLRVPHTYVLLVGLIALAAAATWIIPAGSYDRVVENGREIVAPLSYHRVEARPAGLGELFLAFPRGLLEIAGIVFYIFIIGGAFGVLDGTGVIRAGVRALVRRLGGGRASSCRSSPSSSPSAAGRSASPRRRSSSFRRSSSSPGLSATIRSSPGASPSSGPTPASPRPS